MPAPSPRHTLFRCLNELFRYLNELAWAELTETELTVQRHQLGYELSVRMLRESVWKNQKIETKIRAIFRQFYRAKITLKIQITLDEFL